MEVEEEDDETTDSNNLFFVNNMPVVQEEDIQDIKEEQNNIQEEQAIRRQLNEQTFDNITPFNTLEVSPSQKYDPDCKPMKYENRFNSYGLLGSIYN